MGLPQKSLIIALLPRARAGHHDMALPQKCLLAAATALLPRAARAGHHAYDALACAASAPWCVVADAKRDQVLVLDLESKALAAVWGQGGAAGAGSVWAAGLDEPRSLAVIRNDRLILVGQRGGLAALRTSTLDVSSLNCGWHRDWGAPVSRSAS